MSNLVILNNKQGSALTEILAKLEEGQQLSLALKDYVSQATYYQLLIAERHGQLDESIAQLGKLLKRRIAQRAKLQSLLIYPLLLLGLLVLIIVAVHVWLRPALAQFGMMPNPAGQINWVKLSGYCLAVILVIVGVYLGKLFWWWKKQPTLTKHHWYSQLPLIGKFYRQYSYYYLSFNLGLLLQSGMDFQQICYFLGDFDKQSLLYQLGLQLKLWLEKGDELREFIALYPFIPPELVFFFSKGQTQAELSKEILLYSQLAYQKLLRQLDNLINLVQPLLFLVIAAIIIGTYLAILLPLYRNMGGLYRWEKILQNQRLPWLKWQWYYLSSVYYYWLWFQTLVTKRSTRAVLAMRP